MSPSQSQRFTEKKTIMSVLGIKSTMGSRLSSPLHNVNKSGQEISVIQRKTVKLSPFFHLLLTFSYLESEYTGTAVR